MLLRVKHRPSQSVEDALAKNLYLPSFKITTLREANGVVLDVDPADCREFMEALEELGFDCYVDDEDEME
jgi:hypothetical protein